MQSKLSDENAVEMDAGQLVKKRAPTLYGIIAFKVFKGAVFAALSIAAYRLSDDDLPLELQNLLHFFRIQPDTQFWTAMAEKVGQLTQVRMLWAAAGLFAYSLFGWVEGIGLIFRVSWAGWLAIGESVFFIPIEILELSRSLSWGVVIVLIINIVICWYLFRNRRRLFHHHHHEKSVLER